MQSTSSDLVASLVVKLAGQIRGGMLPVGSHLVAQQLADRYSVSRSPVTEALKALVRSGLVRHEPNRGFFVADRIGPESADGALPEPPDDVVTRAYRKLAEDRLADRIPPAVSTAFIKESYGLTQAQLTELLTRVVHEGWVERRAGYGIQFTQMLNTADALAQTYRVRMALEPAALLEPGYYLDPQVADELRRVEEYLLSGGVETMATEDLYERGVRFHETIVGGSRNPFFLDALKRINKVRRLLAYRSMSNRERYYGQAKDHLGIINLLAEGRNEEASWALRLHLGRVVNNLASLRPLLEPEDASS